MSEEEIIQLLNRFVETDDEEEAAKLGDFIYAEFIKRPGMSPIPRWKLDPSRLHGDKNKSAN